MGGLESIRGEGPFRDPSGLSDAYHSSSDCEGPCPAQLPLGLAPPLVSPCRGQGRPCRGQGRPCCGQGRPHHSCCGTIPPEAPFPLCRGWSKTSPWAPTLRLLCIPSSPWLELAFLQKITSLYAGWSCATPGMGGGGSSQLTSDLRVSPSKSTHAYLLGPPGFPSTKVHGWCHQHGSPDW